MAGHAGFVVCDECKGERLYPPSSVECTCETPRHEICTPFQCAFCGGSGLVATDELREKAADTLLHVLYLGSDRSQLGSTQVRMHERAADAVLRLVAEHLGEAT